jgi:hypothetical protein
VLRGRGQGVEDDSGDHQQGEIAVATAQAHGLPA